MAKKVARPNAMRIVQKQIRDANKRADRHWRAVDNKNYRREQSALYKADQRARKHWQAVDNRTKRKEFKRRIESKYAIRAMRGHVAGYRLRGIPEGAEDMYKEQGLSGAHLPQLGFEGSKGYLVRRGIQKGVSRTNLTSMRALKRYNKERYEAEIAALKLGLSTRLNKKEEGEGYKKLLDARAAIQDAIKAKTASIQMIHSGKGKKGDMKPLARTNSQKAASAATAGKWADWAKDNAEWVAQNTAGRNSQDKATATAARSEFMKKLNDVLRPFRQAQPSVKMTTEAAKARRSTIWTKKK